MTTPTARRITPRQVYFHAADSRLQEAYERGFYDCQTAMAADQPDNPESVKEQTAEETDAQQYWEDNRLPPYTQPAPAKETPRTDRIKRVSHHVAGIPFYVVDAEACAQLEQQLAARVDQIARLENLLIETTGCLLETQKEHAAAQGGGEEITDTERLDHHIKHMAATHVRFTREDIDRSIRAARQQEGKNP